MANPTEILVVCTHEDIMATILRLINNNPEWHATGAANIDDAEGFLNDNQFDLLLLGNGLTAFEEQQISDHALSKNPGIKIILHFGGGSGLLFGEIHEALAGR